MIYRPLPIDVFWTAQRGRRFTISMSEAAAWASLAQCWAYSDDPTGWSVERTRETVPIVVGKAFMAESEIFVFDKSGQLISVSSDLERKTPSDTIPQLWFCERGDRMAIVAW